MKRYSNPLDGFSEFVRTYPEWQLSQLSPDQYQLSYRQVTQQDTYGLNPEDPQAKTIRPGAYAPFVLSAVSEVTFDENSLNFRFSGQTFRCDGRAGTVSVRR